MASLTQGRKKNIKTNLFFFLKWPSFKRCLSNGTGVRMLVYEVVLSTTLIGNGMVAERGTPKNIKNVVYHLSFVPRSVTFSASVRILRSFRCTEWPAPITTITATTSTTTTTTCPQIRFDQQKLFVFLLKSCLYVLIRFFN